MIPVLEATLQFIFFYTNVTKNSGNYVKMFADLD